jgi:hypothetical protein
MILSFKEFLHLQEVGSKPAGTPGAAGRAAQSPSSPEGVIKKLPAPEVNP